MFWRARKGLEESMSHSDSKMTIDGTGADVVSKWRWLLVLPLLVVGYTIPGMIARFGWDLLATDVPILGEIVSVFARVTQIAIGSFCSVCFPVLVAPSHKGLVAAISGLIIVVLSLSLLIFIIAAADYVDGWSLGLLGGIAELVISGAVAVLTAYGLIRNKYGQEIVADTWHESRLPDDAVSDHPIFTGYESESDVSGTDPTRAANTDELKWDSVVRAMQPHFFASKKIVGTILHNVETPKPADGKISFRFRSSKLKNAFMEEMQNHRSRDALKAAITDAYGSELELRIISPHESAE